MAAGFQLVGHTGFVMAFSIVYGLAYYASPLRGGKATCVAGFVIPSHGILVGAVAHFVPVQLAVGTHRLIFGSVAEKFVDMDGLWVYCGYCGMQFLHFSNTGGIIAVGVLIASVAFVRSQPFYEVETETVNFICFHPIGEHVDPVLRNKPVVLVPVIEHVVLVWGLLVIERVCVDVVHLIPWMFAVRLVEHDVENHGYAVAVAFCNEITHIFGRTIGFVKCHVVVGVIAP